MKSFRRFALYAVAAAWWLLLTWRLADLQLFRHEEFIARAENQQQRVVELEPPRGTIYDSRGRQLAVSVEVRSLAADPSLIEDPAGTAETLAEVLDLDADELGDSIAKAKEAGRAFLWVQRKLDPPQIERVRELELKGVFTLPESKRYYPMGQLAAHVLGYVGTDHQGLGGLEFLYDAVVKSEKGRRTVVRDARRGTFQHPGLEVSEAKSGRSLHLTLDATLQHVVERELEAMIESSNAPRGTVVLMDPHSGAILAMASYPTFDPNHFTASPKSHWRNQAVESAYEPGSTFKMVTLAAAFEANVVDPIEKIDCQWGGITLQGVRINDHHPFGELTTREVIAKSSNVGAIKLALAAGRERLYDTTVAFGFGQRTGVDLPSESAGILRSIERWTALEPAYVSFGQSFSITALQLANAFAAIANGGYLLRPYIVEAISGEEGVRQPHRGRDVVRQPIARSSVIQVRSMLESVVLDGTGEAAAVAGYRVAGKTGTGEKAFPGLGYVDGKHIASFAGFAPIREPALVCVVVLDEPWPNYHGGDVAAPVFSRIVRQALLYLGIEPDGERKHAWSSAPELSQEVT